MIKTTVVIPNYQGINYIEDCLNSVYKSSIPLEVIVVDNASADGSLELVRERFPQTRIISFEENKGFSAAVNAGIRAAVTEYVLLLNNDTVVDVRALEYLEKELERYPEAFSVSAKLISLKEPEKLDGAGDFYCALGWAFARGRGKSSNLWTKADIRQKLLNSYNWGTVNTQIRYTKSQSTDIQTLIHNKLENSRFNSC